MSERPWHQNPWMWCGCGCCLGIVVIPFLLAFLGVGGAFMAFRNVGIALEAAGAGWDDVVKLVIYIVGYDAEKAQQFFAGIGEAFGGGMPSTATTLIGVASLFQPEFLVEIDATAAV